MRSCAYRFVLRFMQSEHQEDEIVVEERCFFRSRVTAVKNGSVGQSDETLMFS